MPIPVSDILNKTSIILNDEDFIRWTKEELIGWLNDAAGEIVIRRPQARLIVQVMPLAQGALQKLPIEAVQLIDVVRNVPGRSISRVSRRLLDDQQPDWYDMRATKRIKHFTVEEETPTYFYVYPPASENLTVEVRYSSRPPHVQNDNESVDLDYAYIGPIISYILYRALSKDSEYANGQIAITHFQAFSEAIGVNNAMTQALTANAGGQ